MPKLPAVWPTFTLSLVVVEHAVPLRVGTVLICLLYGAYVQKHFGARYAAVPYGAAAALGFDWLFQLFS